MLNDGIGVYVGLRFDPASIALVSGQMEESTAQLGVLAAAVLCTELHTPHPPPL